MDVRVWESASGCAATTQDAWVVAEVGDRLRLAALDGITPTRDTPSAYGFDGAAWAARFTAAVLDTPVPAVDALNAANRALVSRYGDLRHRDRPHASVAVVDIGVENVEITVAGDCQVFVGHDAEWRELFGGPLFDAETRMRWQRWRDEHPGVDPVHDIADGYEQILAFAKCWRSTPIGLFADPHYEPVTIPRDECDHVVVASDGARLTAQNVADLDTWLDGLRERERVVHSHAHKPHDDVVVISART